MPIEELMKFGAVCRSNGDKYASPGFGAWRLFMPPAKKTSGNQF
jgi:hypothetical protein